MEDNLNFEAIQKKNLCIERIIIVAALQKLPKLNYQTFPWQENFPARYSFS